MSSAFIFPGQGSQSIGMLADLAAGYPLVEQTFAEASEALGFDLWRVAQEGPEARLNSTDVTQPAMLAAGVATYRVWLDQGGVPPALMAGHSLGEYSALTCAGAMQFSAAARLVAARGRLMQEAVSADAGAMAALLGLDDDAVQTVCAEAAGGEVVDAVNFNSPGQVVIAGHRSAVERAVELAKSRGAKRAVMLPVSVPSHCSLMRPAAEKLGQLLKEVDIGSPNIPVVNNVDVAAPSDPEEIRSALSRQLFSPVRWVETIRYLAQAGADRVVECGPGKVLVGLNKRINKELKTVAVYDSASLREALDN